MSTTDTTSMATVDPDLLATITDVLAAHAPTPRDPERGVALDTALWKQLGELGLARLTGSEEHGGSGASWAEAGALLATAAGHAVALPVAEHDLLAGWVLEQAGLPVDDALRTVAELDASGAARAVPWARAAEHVVCVWADDAGAYVADVPASALTLTEGLNLAGEPRDDVAVDLASLSGTAVSAEVVEGLRLRAALARAVQVSGALERCLELVGEHVTTRVQFGRPLARFQAVQHLVADIAAETSLARSAVEAAIGSVPRDDLADLRFRVAVARSAAGHAASVVVRNSHQALGAIGTTLEHELHRYTLAALAWRGEYGSTRHWDTVVAETARAAGRDGLWGLLTD